MSMILVPAVQGFFFVKVSTLPAFAPVQFWARRQLSFSVARFTGGDIGGRFLLPSVFSLPQLGVGAVLPIPCRMLPQSVGPPELSMLPFVPMSVRTFTA